MKFKFKKLRTRLTFCFLAVAVLSLTALVTIIYSQQKSVILAEEFDKLQIARDLKVMQLSSWIDERMGDLKVAAGDNEIRALEKVFAQNGGESDSSALSTVRDLLQRYLDHYNTYYEFFIISASNGKVMVSTDLSREGLEKSTDIYFTEPMRTKQFYIKDVYYSETEHGPAMTFSSPIFSLNNNEEKVIGVLVARVNLEQDFYPLLQDRTGMGETGETLIVNKNVVALNDLRWQKDAILNLTISAVPAVKAAKGETGIVESGDYRGEQVLAAYTHIPQTGWGFVAKCDLTEVYAPIHAMLRRVMFVSIVIILVVILVSMLIARSISKPVIKLTHATSQMASGEEGIRVSVRTGDEIEVLATAFNQMASRLDIVREKTKALDWIKTGITAVDDVMRGEKELSRLCTDIITTLSRYLNIQVGTLSLADHEKAELIMAGSFAYKPKPGAATTFRFGEGLVGQAALEKEQVLVDDVSEEHITVTSALGEMTPRSILCVPLMYEGEVNGVIELGALQSFTESQLQLLEQTAEGIAIAIHAAQSREKMQYLLEKSQTQAEELQTQQEELRVSNEELEEKNDELAEQHEQHKKESREN